MSSFFGPTVLMEVAYPYIFLLIDHHICGLQGVRI